MTKYYIWSSIYDHFGDGDYSVKDVLVRFSSEEESSRKRFPSIVIVDPRVLESARRGIWYLASKDRLRPATDLDIISIEGAVSDE